MESRISNAFTAMPSRAKLAFYAAIVFALLLVLAGNGYAATPSNASLSGSYNFHLTTTKEAYWSASKTCGPTTKQYTAFVDGFTAYTQLVRGVMTFDGRGNVTKVVYTQVNKFDQAATDATIKITCTTNGGWTSNNVQPVFYAPAAGSGSGTYSAASTGSGSITLEVHDTGSTTDNSVQLDFDLGGADSGIASTVLLRSPDTFNSHDFDTGTAVHQ